MKRYPAIALLMLVCLPAYAQQSNEDYYAEQRAIQDQQFAADLNRRTLEQAQDAAYEQEAQAQAQAAVAQAAYVPPRYYGAVATDGEALSVASYHQDPDEADASAIAACEQATGAGRCRSFRWFSEQCASFARGVDGTIHAAYSPYPSFSARDAMKACMADGTAGKCRLMTLPLCVGSQYGAQDINLAMHATARQLEIWSEPYDTREYWGAIAVDQAQTYRASADLPTEAAATESLVGSSDCLGCALVKTFRNTCAGIADLKDLHAPRHPTLVIDNNPAQARDRARDQCAAEAGAVCTAWVQCDGRAYIDDPLSGQKAE